MVPRYPFDGNDPSTRFHSNLRPDLMRDPRAREDRERTPPHSAPTRALIAHDDESALPALLARSSQEGGRRSKLQYVEQSSYTPKERSWPSTCLLAGLAGRPLACRLSLAACCLLRATLLDRSPESERARATYRKNKSLMQKKKIRADGGHIAGTFSRHCGGVFETSNPHLTLPFVCRSLAVNTVLALFRLARFVQLAGWPYWTVLYVGSMDVARPDACLLLSSEVPVAVRIRDSSLN